MYPRCGLLSNRILSKMQRVASPDRGFVCKKFTPMRANFLLTIVLAACALASIREQANLLKDKTLDRVEAVRHSAVESLGRLRGWLAGKAKQLMQLAKRGEEQIPMSQEDLDRQRAAFEEFIRQLQEHLANEEAREGKEKSGEHDEHNSHEHHDHDEHGRCIPKRTEEGVL